MNLWRLFKDVLFVLFLLSLPIGMMGGVASIAGVYFPQETTYDYEVKAQQVMDGDRVEDSDITPMEDLSADEQRLLYDAFKKSDHFMGTSEVTLSYQEERLDTFTDWRTIESNGVLLLVAVEETTEQRHDTDAYKWHHTLVSLSGIYALLGMLVLWIGAMLSPP